MSDVEETDKADKAGFTPPASQEDLNRIIDERLKREREKFKDYPDLKKKADDLDKIEAANATELEKANARADAAEKLVAELEPEILRWKTIAQNEIPPDYQDFIVGKSEEDLAAVVEKVKTLIPAPEDHEPVRELVVAGEGKSPAAVGADPLAAMLTQAVS